MTRPGSWDLSFERGNRRCRLTLRSETAPGGFALAMPAGCHRAFPMLAAVTGWVPTSADHVVLQNAANDPVIDFAPKGGPTLEASVGQGGETYVLTPTDAHLRDVLAGAAVATEALPPPAPECAAHRHGDGVGRCAGRRLDARVPHRRGGGEASPPSPRPRCPAIIAVLRDDRDTGCMVTLESEGARASRAKLAPACRDQGIVIFDPVAWQLAKDELVLTAKKGHKAVLTRQANRTWATAPVKGAAPGSEAPLNPTAAARPGCHHRVMGLADARAASRNRRGRAE